MVPTGAFQEAPVLHRFHPALPLVLALVSSALSLGGAPTASALVGTSASFYNAPVCRQLGCVYQGVRRTKLEGSGNPVQIYRYGLASGQQIEVTRYDLSGQPGNDRIYSVRYLGGAARNAATIAARLASAAAGYQVTVAQVTPCLQNRTANAAQSQFVASRGFEAPSVLCSSSGTRPGVLIQLTN